MPSFTIVPRGSFSLPAAAGFGFGGSLGAPAYDGAMRLAFVVDGFEEQAAVALRQRDDGTIEGDVQGAAEIDAVRRQVARILSLDHDGDAWAAVGERDPVIGRLQREHPGQRPVLFHSPYEAAAWAIISARRPAAQGAEIRRRLSEERGARFEVAGSAMAAFPLPPQVLALAAFPGLNEAKVDRLRGVGEAALDGRLDPPQLVALDPEEAMAQVQTIPGIGPFYAGLIVVRASGVADVALQEPKAMAQAARLYELDGPPDSATWTELSDGWRPFRTWAMVLMRLSGERAGVT